MCIGYKQLEKVFTFDIIHKISKITDMHQERVEVDLWEDFLERHLRRIVYLICFLELITIHI